MAQQTINIGASPNDGTGTPLRTAFQYTNSNFSELYTAVGPSGNNIVVPGAATITGDLTVDTNVLKVNTTTNRVGINTTTPSQNLEITGSGNPLVADGCSAVRLNNTVSGRPAVVGVDDSQNFVIWNVGTEVSETIKFLTGGGNGKEQYRITHGGLFNWYDGAGGTRMTLDATGLGVGVVPSAGKGALQLSSGITFPATQVASSDANTLDDYEEGTWTIGLTFGGGNTGLTTVLNTGRYTKIGRQVTVCGRLELSNKGSSTGAAVITGLPFSIANTNDAQQAASFRCNGVSYTGAFQGYGLAGSTTIPLEQISEAGSLTDLTDSNFVNGTSIQISLTYTV